MAFRLVHIDEWNKLLIGMFDACKTGLKERELPLQFIGKCIDFVDKCKYFNLLHSFTTESNKNLRVRHSLYPQDEINVNSVVLCSLECRSIKLIVYPFPSLHC